MVSNFHSDVYGDECNCPIGTETWKKALKCPSSYRQIDEDLKRHKIIDLSTLRKKIKKRIVAPSNCICHYVVKSNKVL